MPRPRRRNAVIIAATAVLALAAGTTAWAVTGNNGASYRAATAMTGAVEQTVSATGTVSPVHSAAANFEVSGTVAKVVVKVGRRVKVGQVLARLDESTLKTTLRTDRSSLASARTKLSDDQSGQSDVATAGTAANPPTSRGTLLDAHPTPAPSPRPSSGSSTGTGGSGVSHDQTVVRRDQQLIDGDLQRAAAALAAVKTACDTAAPSDGSSGASPTPTPTTTSAPPASDCATASAALLAEQTTTSDDEQALATAEQALNADLQSALSAPQAGSGSATQGSSGSATRQRSGAASNESTLTVSAADLATDQASIDEARAEVATANADLRQATLRSPINGAVTAVTIHHGDAVGSGSASSPEVEVVGAGQDQVALALSDTEIRHVRVGMPATVVADGTSRSVTGHVATINVGGTESDTGAVSYPVTVTMPNSPNLVNGAAAAVTVVVSTVHDVLTVPTSAVHHSGSATYVEVLGAGTPARRTVTIGAIGAARTEVRSGLTAGQRVVLANLDQSVPSSSSTLTGRNFGRRALTVTGGFGGTGPPAGFGGSAGGFSRATGGQ